MNTFHVDEPREIGKKKDRLSSRDMMMVKQNLTEKVLKEKLKKLVKKEINNIKGK